MDSFAYRGRRLFAEDVPLHELALQFGTPLYVYSHATLSRHFTVFDGALSGVDHLICYSVKANGNLALIRSVANLGGGADVVSGGELFRCLEAGVPPGKIVFSGVGKSIQEIEYALRRKILMLNVESASELRQVALVAQALGVKAPVGLRLNPDVDPKTHAYVATGLKENKFGLSRDEVFRLFGDAKKSEHLEPTGLALHIGSQLTELSPFVDALKIAVAVVGDLRKSGISIRHLDFGGGLGVPYRGETPPSPEVYAEALLPIVRDRDLTLILEPGRVLIGNAGVLITRVLSVKRTPEKTFVIVDAGMNDLIRPSLYGAEHDIVPVTKAEKPLARVDVVGPVCETGDFLARGREMEETDEGELLCVRTAGAYGFSMSSQYNARPRPAEVLVHGEQVDLIRRRESFEDLIRGETVPAWLREGA